MAIVHCRICKGAFDRVKLKEGVDWVMPSKNFYYHKRCYDGWIVNSNDVKAQLADEEFIPFIYSFFSQDLKVSYDYMKCESQRKNFVKNKNCTNKGIYFALKYYYEIQGNSWDKSQGGIGIVPYIYNESREYWQKRVMREEDIMDKIIKQMQERAARPAIKVKKVPKAKPKWEMPWEEIEASEDE